MAGLSPKVKPLSRLLCIQFSSHAFLYLLVPEVFHQVFSTLLLTHRSLDYTINSLLSSTGSLYKLAYSAEK